jgi:hypothetical protein
MKIILPILLLFIVLAVLSAQVNLPGTDEAWQRRSARRRGATTLGCRVETRLDTCSRL